MIENLPVHIPQNQEVNFSQQLNELQRQEDLMLQQLNQTRSIHMNGSKLENLSQNLYHKNHSEDEIQSKISKDESIKTNQANLSQNNNS